jgi:dienelactone hydrolase
MAIRGLQVRLIVVAMLSLFVVTACGGGGGEDADTSAVVDDGGNDGGGPGGTPPSNQRPDPTPPSGGPSDDPGFQGGPGDPGSPPGDDDDDPPGDDTPPSDDDPPDTAAELYAPGAGSHTAATPALLTLHDWARDKDLDLRVSWPAAGSNFPVIIFSHGYNGTMLLYEPLTAHWVSHGYVTIQPDHADSYLIPEEDRASYEDWYDRVQDISFVIDSLEQIEASVTGLQGKLNHGLIGVAGHSFGAQTAQLSGGALTINQLFLPDERIDAALLISPQGVGEMLDENSWSAFTNPMMVITGTNDDGDRTDDPWTWRTEPYYYAPPGSKHLVVIDGAYHNMGGIAGFVDASNGPPNDTHVMYVQSSGTAFFDAYLKNSPVAQGYLASDDMETATDDAIAYEYK